MIVYSRMASPVLDTPSELEAEIYFIKRLTFGKLLKGFISVPKGLLQSYTFPTSFIRSTPRVMS